MFEKIHYAKKILFKTTPPSQMENLRTWKSWVGKPPTQFNKHVFHILMLQISPRPYSAGGKFQTIPFLIEDKLIW